MVLFLDIFINNSEIKLIWVSFSNFNLFLILKWFKKVFEPKLFKKVFEPKLFMNNLKYISVS